MRGLNDAAKDDQMVVKLWNKYNAASGDERDEIFDSTCGVVAALRAENADLRKRLAEASARERQWIDRLYALVNNGWQYATPNDPNGTYDIYDENTDHIGSGHGLDAAIDDAMKRTRGISHG